MSIVSSRKVSRQRTQPNGPTSRASLSIWLIGAAILFLTLLLVVIKLNNPQAAATITQPAVPAAWIDRTTLGNPDAKVLIEAYEDFLCAHCLEWHNTVQPQLLEEYVKPGKVRLTFINFPLTELPAGSQLAAQASQCAADQNAFWAYHDQLFAVQTQGLSAFTLERLVEYATKVALDEGQFAQCMNSLAHQETVATAARRGLDRGVTGTPTFFVNGQMVRGDYVSLQAAIEQQLAIGKKS